MNNPFEEQVMTWHTRNGGFSGRPAGHALRMLREAVELCFAAGSSEQEIIDAVGEEITKAIERSEITNKLDIKTIGGECADVQLLLTLFASRFGIDIEQQVAAKMKILYERKWEADKDGVLWREGRIPNHSEKE